jgi:U3 small nucleolar RNA-associated protein 3
MPPRSRRRSKGSTPAVKKRAPRARGIGAAGYQYNKDEINDEADDFMDRRRDKIKDKVSVRRSRRHQQTEVSDDDSELEDLALEQQHLSSSAMRLQNDQSSDDDDNQSSDDQDDSSVGSGDDDEEDEYENQQVDKRVVAGAYDEDLDENQNANQDSSDEDDDSDSDSDSAGNDQEFEHDAAMRIWKEDAETKFQEQRQKQLRDEEHMAKDWGKRKANYYAADTADIDLESDEEAAELEEEEARRLQMERAEALDEDDVDINGMLDAVVPAKATKGKRKGKTSKSSSGGLAAALHLAGGLGGSSNADGVQLQKVQRDMQKLSKDEKLQLVIKDSPELLGLLDDLKARLNEVRMHIQPVIDRVRSGKIETSQGISFLEMKYHVMIMYCTHIVFYLYLKAEGRSVKNHPVVKQLVHLRTILEKIKPIDSKLKYQVDKLVRQANKPAGSSTKSQSGGADPLSFKPQPSQLLSSKQREANDGDAVYRPPRMAAAEMVDEKSKAKEKRAREKALAKASRSSLVRQLRDEIEQRPEEMETFGTEEFVQDQDDAERQRFEEEFFMRLPESKKDRAKRLQGKQRQMLADFEDFGDVTAFSAGVEKRRQQVKANALSRKRAAAAAAAAADDFGDAFGDEAALAEAEAFYDKVESASRARKKKKLASRAETDNGAYLNPVDPDSFIDDPSGRRKINKEIEKNRGLTRYRPRDRKNPRVRQRLRYEKAVSKRRSQVQEYQGKEHNYAGTATGIKANLVRSRRLG